ncbi:hypothetical protein BH18ACT5_BH18ACT5_03590 [soil metagenome]
MVFTLGEAAFERDTLAGVIGGHTLVVLDNGFLSVGDARIVLGVG